MGLRVSLGFLFLFSFFSSRAQELFEDQINVASGGKADYRDAVVYLPANYSKNKAYPLVIFTHGMGEAGKNVKKLYKQGLPKVLKGGYRPPFDFIMVAVQRNSFSVSPDWLPGILKDCEKRWKIDESRIYLTGLSAGGWAVYGSQLNISPAFAKKFAAIVINSAVTHNTNKKNFDWWKQTKTPLWAIVGSADKGYVGRNAYMVNEINKRVPKLAALTVRKGVGHGGWTDVYKGKVKLNGKNMWEWLYQFKRASGNNPKPPVEQAPPAEEVPPAKNDPDDDDEKEIVTTKFIKVNIFRGVNPSTNKGWNNWDVGAVENNGINSGRFEYTDGSASTIKAELSNSYRVFDNLPDYGGGIVPASVLRYGSYAKKARTLTISGLSPSKVYTVTLFGSRRNRPGRTTMYRVNEDRRYIETNNSHTDQAVFSKISSDANGRIVVHIEGLNYYNYLNAFQVTERTPAKK